MAQIWQFTAQDPYEAMQAGMEQARKNRLNDIDVAEKVRAYEASKVLNELYNKMVDPATGQIDRNRLYGGMAARGYGGMIPGLQTAQAELEAKQAKAFQDRASGAKALSDVEAASIKANRDALAPVNNQAGWDAWRARAKQQYRDVPNIDQVFDQIVPPVYSAENKQAAMMTADQVLDQHFVTQDYGSGTRVLAMPKYGPGKARVVENSDIAMGVSPNRPQTTVITQSETERAKTLGKLSGEDVMARYKNVQSSVRGLQKSNEALALLKQGKPVTGLGADLELGISRLQKAVAGREDKSISDTELLEAVLGQDVFQQIQQLGIGARGLDTPAEREFLRSVVSGTKTLDKQTLIKMAEARRNAQEDIIRSWNEDTKSGDLDSFYRDTGYRKKEYALPERKAEARQLSPQDQEALDWANSNPRDPRAAKIKKRLEGK